MLEPSDDVRERDAGPDESIESSATTGDARSIKRAPARAPWVLHLPKPVPYDEKYPVVQRHSYDSNARLAASAPVAVAATEGLPLRIFDASTGEELRVMHRPCWDSSLWRFDVDASGETIALLDRANRIWFWRWRHEARPRVVDRLPGSISPEVRLRKDGCVEYSPDGARCVVGHRAGGSVLLDEDGERIRQLEAGVAGPNDPSTMRATGWGRALIGWSADGARLVAPLDGEPRLFDSTTGSVLDVRLDLPSQPLSSIALSPSGGVVVSGHLEGVVALTSADSGQRIWTHHYVDRLLGPYDGGFSDFNASGVAIGRRARRVGVALDTPVRGLVLDIEDGVEVGFSEWNGGRMGTPVEIVAHDEGFMMAYVNSGPIRRMHFGAGARGMRESLKDFATLPDVGWNGLAFFAGDSEYRLVDPTTWEFRWSAVIEPDGTD